MIPVEFHREESNKITALMTSLCRTQIILISLFVVRHALKLNVTANDFSGVENINIYIYIIPPAH